ncbi:MAG: esterase/lipase family protein [Candidatus Binatia bacterium]
MTVAIALDVAQAGPMPEEVPGAMPGSLGEILDRAGEIAREGQRRVLDTLPGALPTPPAVDAEVAARMAQARREDVVVEATDALFAEPMISLGQWQSAFFAEHYGTALFLAAPYAEDRIPVVLVHGINGSPRDFKDMLPRFDDTRYQPILFFYPTGMALQDAARQLGRRLKELAARHPAPRYALVAHSMGGLVTKGAIDAIDTDVALPGQGVFVSIASPWAGVDGAQYADHMPNHPPVWNDMAPGSPYIDTIQRTAWPQRMPFYLFFAARSGRPLMAPLGNNDGVLTLESVLVSPLTRSARDVFGFYEDHVTILQSPLVFRRLRMVLDAELGEPVAWPTAAE